MDLEKNDLKNGRPLWLLISGPSGVGKSTLIEKMLLAYFPQLQPVITATTRAMRPGEKEGKPYYFLTPEDFAQKTKEGQFLETIHRHGGLYGTLRSEIENKLAAQRDLIMHIDWQGRRHLAELAKKEKWLSRAMVSVFLRPASMDVLKARLEGRGRHSAAELDLRLRTAAEDFEHILEYDYHFVSGSYEEDFQSLKKIYLAEKAKAL